MKDLGSELNQTIERSLDRAYKLIALEEGYRAEELHYKPQCLMMTVAFTLEMGDEGIAHVRHDSRHGHNVNEHRYAVLDINDEEIVIDPTWQQFLSPHLRSPELPRTLIGTREEVIAIALAAGVDHLEAQLWAPRGMYPEPENPTPQERIARAIDANPPSVV